MVYAMDEATLFDSFFNYLQEIKVFPHLEQLDPQKQRRKNVPFVAFDRYDDRSLMENKLFREVKQNWHFEHPAKKTKEGVYIQTYMTMGMKALTTAFLRWQEEQLQLEALGKQTTWQMYRRKLKVLNRNKLIVFVDQHFGIFPSHEVFMLANVPVHDIAKELNITREQVYAKYTQGILSEKF